MTRLNYVTIFSTGLAIAAAPSALAQARDTVVITGVSTDYAPTTTTAAGVLGDRDLIDTPYSVSVFTEALIENQQARSPLDILKNEPSVLVTNTGLTLADTFSVRGFSLNNLANFRQDGGFLVNLSNIPIETKERVEVLKGATGFMYGFTAPGGIVNYVAKRPTEKTFVGLKAGMSDESLFYSHVDANIRFGTDQQFGLRANAAVEAGELAVSGAELNRSVGALALNWRALPTLSFDVDYEHQKRNAHGLQDALILGSTITVIPDAPDASRLFGQEWETYDTVNDTSGARVTWTPNDIFKVEVRAGRSDFERAIDALTATLTNLNGTFTGIYSGDDKQRFVADSAQALGFANFETGPIKHEIVGGWMGLDHAQYRGDFIRVNVQNNNLYNPVQYARPIPVGSARNQYKSLQQYQDSFLLSDTLSLGPVSAVVGVRRQHYKQVSLSFTGAATATYSKEVDTPTYALIYKPWSFASFYASYVEGLEQGGTAPLTALNAGETLPPLESEQTEFGAKFLIADRLTLNAAVFEIEKGLEYLDTTSRLFIQNGRQNHRGFEATIGGEVLPGLSLVGGYTYLDAEAKNTGSTTTSGKRPTNVPENSISLFGEYQVDFVPGLAVSAGVRNISDFAYDATNTRFVPGYTTVDFGARYVTKLADVPLVLRLNVNNATDENYWAGTAATALYIGAPRTVRLSAQTTF